MVKSRLNDPHCGAQAKGEVSASDSDTYRLPLALVCFLCGDNFNIQSYFSSHILANAVAVLNPRNFLVQKQSPHSPTIPRA